MLRKHYSLKHANKILNRLFSILGEAESETEARVIVECWSNGREQGYFLRKFPVSELNQYCVCFAQQRNSDELVVLCGPLDCFDITTNMPNKEIWSQQKCFEDDDEAVAYIIDKLGVIDEAIKNIG